MENIIVLGDCMLDKYTYCQARKINSECPNIVFKEDEIVYKLGGAGNVAKNLSNLNFNVFFITDIGSDLIYQNEILQLLQKHNIISDYLVKSKKKTTVKNRFICQQSQIFRIDKESAQTISEELENVIVNNINNLIQGQQIKYLVISDYDKGFLSQNLCQTIIKMCQINKILVFTDPKMKNPLKYASSFLLKPNRIEFKTICDYYHLICNPGKTEILNCICNKLNILFLLITLDKENTILYNSVERKSYQIANMFNKNKVVDVTGAGDTVLCSIIYYYHQLDDIFQAAKNADKIAKYSVSISGCLDMNTYLLNQIVNQSKIIERNQLQFISRNKKIVFTNGCFDILHAGHVQYLQKSKQLGDILIVGINSDQSIKKLKGKNRPINNLENRIILLQALQCVDYIISFNEDTPYNLISELKPNILVKGADYQIEDVVGRDLVDQVILMDLKKGFSTTNIIKKINNTY